MVRAVASRVIPRQRISKAVAQEATAELSRLEELISSANVPSTVQTIPTRASTNKHTVHALVGTTNHHADVVTNNDNGHEHGSSSIPDLQQAKAMIRPMGNSRRVFLLDSHLAPEDMEGLAYRIRALSRNDSISSVLIATDDQDDTELNCLPRYITNRRDVKHMFEGIPMDDGPPPILSPLDTNTTSSTSTTTTRDHTWYVSGGYDPVKLSQRLREDFHNSDQERSEYTSYALESLRKLAVSVQGGQSTSSTTTGDATTSAAVANATNSIESRVPVITVPHGAVTDGGYALCMGSYVLATPETSFKIMNPSRGLSLDPIGLSFILPRLGWEHSQLSAKFSPACGLIMALTGYEADAFDMVETGLATHLVADNVSGVIPMLEEGLAVMEPWKQQGLVKPYKKFYGQEQDNEARNQPASFLGRDRSGRRQHNGGTSDSNARIRNKRVAYLMDQISDHSSSVNDGDFPYDFTAVYEGSDPSLDVDVVPWDTGFFSSPLVDIAAYLDQAVFRKQNSLEELIELLKEEGSKAENRLAANHGGDGNADGYYEGINIANNLAEKITRQSPLALRVVYQLLKTGGQYASSIESCMDRELRAQRAMMSRPDFMSWSEHVHKHGGDEQTAPPFTGWQHPNVKAVTLDEVEEIIDGGSS